MAGLGQLFCAPYVKQSKDLKDQLDSVNKRFAHVQDINERLTYMLRALTEGIFAVDPDGTLTFWSKGLEKLTGITFERALGKKYTHFFNSSTNLPDDPISKVIEDKQRLVVELEYKRPTAGTATEQDEQRKKSVIPLQMKFLPMFKETGQLVGVVVEVVDLSERKRYEEMQLDFVSIVTHELRTPATSIKGYLSLLLDEGEGLSEEQKTFIRRAYISNERQIHTIESLLTVSKIEQQKFVPNLQDLQIETVVADMVKYVQDDVRAKSLDLRVNYPQFTLPKVWADMSYVRQIVYVLLSNAIKFTEKGFVEVGFRDDTGEVVFYVKDTGSGISPEAQGRIFQRFSRGEHPLTEESQGIGLGLYSAKMMAEKMNGKIWVESEVNKGSTFHVSLPIVMQ